MDTSLRQLSARLLGFLLLMAAPGASWAADVLKNVPEGALGFVLVRDLQRVDADTERLLRTFDVPFPAPLAFLQAATGVGEGIDVRGDFLLALLPGGQAAERPLFAVWLPMHDYTKFIDSLQGTTRDRITAVNVAGEDLLVAQHGEWALVMDPDQRDRMMQVLAARPAAASRLDRWKEWLDANDVTAVLLPNGIRAIFAWATTGDDRAVAAPAEDDDADELFGPSDQSLDLFAEDEERAAGTGDPISVARTAIRRSMSDSPELALLALHTDAAALGLRLDEAGNAVAGVRWASRAALERDANAASGEQRRSLPPTLFSGGEFIVSGGGHFPGAIAGRAAEAYARLLVRGVETDNAGQVDERAAARFVAAAKEAASAARAATVLTHPGKKNEGVYTNNFAVVRVDSAGQFKNRFGEAVRLWNELNHDADGEMRLVFDVESIKIGDRDATEYSIDMTAIFGSPDVPEIRGVMEKLFGPEGKLRLLAVIVDDHTVLLAMSTREQAAAVLQANLAEDAKPGERPELAAANGLLPADADWRLFVSPHGYNAWLKRQTDAMLGPVIGGPIVKDFPRSPPVGLAGGFAAQELWIDAAIPAATIDSAARYGKQR